MVLQSISESETLNEIQTMASPVPAKSQPLHNFSLPHLKWKKNHTNNHHRGRRLSDLPPHDARPRQSSFFDSATRQSPIPDSASESDSGYAVSLKNNSVPENVKTGFSVSYSNRTIEKSDKKWTVSEIGGKERRSKIHIRLRKNKPDDVAEEGNTCTVDGEVEESVPKTWNLRPRRPLYKLFNGNSGFPKVGGSPMRDNKAQSPQAIQNRPESEAMTTEKKQKFSIAISRDEIDEDIFAMTGSKPSRRPKKRSRTIQKQLDNLFPGLWLDMITPDSYKVSEAPAKG